MLEKLIAYTLRQKGMVIFLALLIIVIGVYSYAKLPIDAFPDVTNIQVEVVSHADGLSAIEIERNVTYPIEMAMRGLPDIEQMRSVTKFGLSIVTIVFKDNVDIYFAGNWCSSVWPRPGRRCRRGSKSPWGPSARPWERSISTPWKGRCPETPGRRSST